MLCVQLLQEQINLINEHSDELFGVNISGLHLGESPQQREKILSTIYASIPATLVRFVTGPNSPCEVLDSIRLGTDIAVCSYPVSLAEKAYASLFEYFFFFFTQVFERLDSVRYKGECAAGNKDEFVRQRVQGR